MAAGAATAFRAGEVFLEVGDPVANVYFLVSGAASATMPMENGTTVEVLLYGRDCAIGLLAANGPLNTFCRIVAESDGAAIVVPMARFRALVDERSTLRVAVNAHVASMVAQIAKGAACNAVHRLQPRLASWLLRFHDRMEGRELTLTQDHMSRMLGVSRTSMNAVAQELQATGLVRYTRGRVDIVDRKGLERVACDCYRGRGWLEHG